MLKLLHTDNRFAWSKGPLSSCKTFNCLPALLHMLETWLLIINLLSMFIPKTVIWSVKFKAPEHFHQRTPELAFAREKMCSIIIESFLLETIPWIVSWETSDPLTFSQFSGHCGRRQRRSGHCSQRHQNHTPEVRHFDTSHQLEL